MPNDCTPLNPCNCISTCKCNRDGAPSPKPPCPTGNCLFLCDGVVAASDGVGCGQTGTFDLTTLDHDFSACSDTPTITVTNYSNHFSSANVVGTNLLWTPSGDEFGYGEVNIKTTCKNSDGQKLTYHSCVTIGVTDMCLMVDTPEGCVCNPCNGEHVCTDGQTVPHGSDLPTDTTNSCGDPVTYSIISYDSTYFSNVTIDSLGQINYDLVCSDLLKVSFTSEIEYSASACGATDYSVEVINFTPLCESIDCGVNEICNHCDGLCEKIDLGDVQDVSEVPVNPIGTPDSSGICPKDSGFVTVQSNPVKQAMDATKLNQPPTCITDITPVDPPVEPEDPCADLEIKDDCGCIICEVIDGKACIIHLEEDFDLSILEQHCPSELVKVVGSCCTEKYFKGTKVETFDYHDDTVCIGDPYLVTGACGTVKESVGTQERTWSCGDTSQFCGQYTVKDTCGGDQVCQGTKVNELIDPIKPEILASICVGTTIECAGTCGPILVEGTKTDGECAKDLTLTGTLTINNSNCKL